MSTITRRSFFVLGLVGLALIVWRKPRPARITEPLAEPEIPWGRIEFPPSLWVVNEPNKWYTLADPATERPIKGRYVEHSRPLP